MNTNPTPSTSLLSKEQQRIRETGIGASEIAAVCGLSPWMSPTDVWMRKRTPVRAPLVDGSSNNMAMRIGNLLKEPLRRLYEREAGYHVAMPEATFRHPQYPFILATPGGICDDGDGVFYNRGLEIKNVGARMARAWEDAERGMPEYVELQARQNMAVLGYDRWDVAALLGGSDFRIFTLERDADAEQNLIEAATYFWEAYVLTDTPPPEPDPARRRELLKALFPGRKGKQCKPPQDAAGFDGLCRELAKIRDTEKAIDAEKAGIENQLFQMIGDDYGIEHGPFKFTWGVQAGLTNYKDIAEDLAGGRVPPDLIEKYRGAPKRVARFVVRG